MKPKTVGVDPARGGPKPLYGAVWGRTPAGGRHDEEGETPFLTEEVLLWVSDARDP